MKDKPSRYILYYIARIISVFVLIVPLRFWQWLARPIGFFCYSVLRKENARMSQNMLLAMPHLDAQSIKKFSIGVYSNLARNLCELISFPKITANYLDRQIKWRGFEKLKRAHLRGKGIIVVTAHFGNWEIVPAAVINAGFPGSVVARKIYFEKYDRYLNSLRKSKGAGVIYRTESPRKMLKVLKEGKVLGILADQDVDSIDGVHVTFFNHKAYTPTAPAHLAMVSGAALVPLLMVREKGKFVCHVEDPIYLDRRATDKKNQILVATQQYTSIFEKYIRRYLDQWVWMHRRWKTKEVIPERVEKKA